MKSELTFILTELERRTGIESNRSSRLLAALKKAVERIELISEEDPQYIYDELAAILKGEKS
jgi:hypothetical protein